MHLISRLMLTGVAVAFLPPFLGIGAQTLEPRSSTSPQHLQDDAGPEITPGNRCHRFVRNPATGKWCPNGFGILHEVGIKNGDLQSTYTPKIPARVLILTARLTHTVGVCRRLNTKKTIR